MSDYISKQEAIDRLSEVLSSQEEFENAKQVINEASTLDEKEIIRKAFERVLQRLESERATENFKALKNANETFIKGCIDNRVFAYSKAIEIVKEECGISE